MRQLVHVDCLHCFSIFITRVYQEKCSISFVNDAMPHKGKDVEDNGFGVCDYLCYCFEVLYIFLDFLGKVSKIQTSILEDIHITCMPTKSVNKQAAKFFNIRVTLFEVL